LFTLAGKLRSERRLRTIVADSFPGDEAAIWREYGDAAANNRWQATASLVTDARFACPAWRMNTMLAAAGTPVWSYEFDDPDAPFALPRFFQPALGAYHAAEIAYVLQRSWALSGKFDFTPAQQALSDRMQAHWGRFARRGDPGEVGGVAWSRLSSSGEPTPLTTTMASPTGRFADRHHCAFWNRLGY
jgi:para-nitrobenzyl esterase